MNRCNALYLFHKFYESKGEIAGLAGTEQSGASDTLKRQPFNGAASQAPTHFLGYGIIGR
ncbi:hypothetical protein [Paraburkholderia humisilvae]|uniref:Uncharacterized protein n=1 Tax=Paraburkholderia humisilvae TaxID=627669 RepID=A0A6J5FBL5_9BURK|nr:hypothetical protein [Paraburkholderia humisilvae]CAB3774605.1 hypothetical protein LMG29542_07983 [Paraburkholderia humisilvae]